MSHPHENRALVGRLLELVATGSLHPVEPTPYPLEQVAEALADLAQRRVGGKVVLVP